MDVQQAMLRSVYRAHMVGRGGPLSWSDWATENGYELEDADRAFYELKELGLVDAHGSGRRMSITPNGIFHAEREKLADADLAKEHDQIRKVVLRTLMGVRDEEGPRGVKSWEAIWNENGLEREPTFTNLKLFQDVGVIKFVASAVKLTAVGVDLARRVLANHAVESKWRALHAEDANPHARGHELERLLKDVADQEGWTAELNVRSAGEENDLIVSREFAYFLFSCKWEKTKTGTTTVRELRDRITARPGSMGVLVSVAGFTSEAVDWARDRLESGVVLFVGPGDLERVFSGEARLMELLLEKHGALMTRRTIVVD